MARVQSTEAEAAPAPAPPAADSAKNNNPEAESNDSSSSTTTSRRKTLDRLIGFFQRLLVHNAVTLEPLPPPPPPAVLTATDSYILNDEAQLDEDVQVEDRRIEINWRALADMVGEKLLRHLERIVLWDSVRDSAVYVLAFNIIYWNIVVFQLRGLAAVGSAAAIMFIAITIVLLMWDNGEQPSFNAKAEQFENLVMKLVWDLHVYMVNLENNYPTGFAFGFPICTLGLAAVLPLIGPMLLIYAALMSIFLVPPVLLWCFGGQLSSTDQDGEISEFLPESTEDNLQVLSRAGESGKHSPTPSNSAHADNSDDEDLEGLNMPSHEDDASTDELDLSDIELGPGDTDTDGVPIKRRRFDHDASSSDSEPEYPSRHNNDDGVARHLDVDETDSSADSDFEIIDNRELQELRNV